MNFFRRSQDAPSMFPIQSGGRFGSISGERETQVFEEAIGERTRSDGASNREYLGLTIPRKRFQIGAILLFIILSFLGARSAQLQVYEGSHFRSLAEGNRYRTHTLVPPRGIVYDRHGTPLIQNVPSFVLSMTIADLPLDPTEKNEVLNRAADLAGLHRADLDLVLTDHTMSPFEAVPVKKGLSYEAALRLAIATATLPGFHLEASSTRSYNMSATSLSHVLGYTGNISPDELAVRKEQGYRQTEDIGKAGIERGAETLLRGTPGKLVVEVDARGNEITMVSKDDPIPGANVTLSIDLSLQEFIEQRLGESMKKLGKTKAAVIAMDPHTGGVRALVSLPSFDSNAFANGIDADLYAQLNEDPDHPLFPRAIAGEYPSGSTFKPFIAYAALAEGIVNASTSFLSTGGLRVGEWFFPDWKAGGHGVTDVRKAIAQSVNTYFYIVSGGFDNVTGLGVERITDYARTFGFGSETGIDIPGEADGFLPSKQWKQEAKGERWYVGDTYHLAIGQGDLLVTPIQLATGIAMIANSGVRVKPHLVEGVDGGGDDAAGSLQLAGGGAGEEFDPAAIQIVREGMRQTVTLGSARSLSDLAYPVAGKTGTAQVSGDNSTHAWFVGFGPYEKPTLSIVILIENGGEGSSVAVPIANDIFGYWFTHEMP